MPVAALVIVAAWPGVARAQYAGFGPLSIPDVYITPTAPYAPKSMQECDRLEREWDAVRESISRQHQSCLDANNGRGRSCADDPQTGCSCIECAPYHNSSSRGQADIDACRQTVTRYQEAERIRKEQEAAEKREAERRQRELDDRRERERQERERADARRRDDAQSRADRRADEADAARRKADQLADIEHLQQNALQQLFERDRRRDEQRDQLRNEDAAAGEKLGERQDQIQQQLTQLADNFNSNRPSIFGDATAAAPALDGSDFDLSAATDTVAAAPPSIFDRAREVVNQAVGSLTTDVNDRVEKMVERVFDAPPALVNTPDTIGIGIKTVVSTVTAPLRGLIGDRLHAIGVRMASAYLRESLINEVVERADPGGDALSHAYTRIWVEAQALNTKGIRNAYLKFQGLATDDVNAALRTAGEP